MKFGLFSAHSLDLVCEGLAERLNSDQAQLHLEIEQKKETVNLGVPGHNKAITVLMQKLDDLFSLNKSLIGIGHRVVHGGETFKQSTVINKTVLHEIKACIPLAPLHNPANLLGIEILAELYPTLPQVAVFDTAFHQSMPDTAFLYGLPYDLYTKHCIRRYGFHGTSHRYVSEQAAKLLNKPIAELNAITAHLGNGASVCAIKDGQSVDTSMGFTPLEGLIMGTRCGDLDPGIYDYLLGIKYSPEDISHMLNKESGLLGISGESNDMRSLTELADQGNTQAMLAIDIFCFRLAKYIAAMMISLDRLDVLIFTGGIGENAALIREKTIDRLMILGFVISKDKNMNIRNSKNPFIHQDNSIPVAVIQTNEELTIAKDTLDLI